MIPMEMGDQRVRMQLSARALVGTEIAKPGSEVEQDRIGTFAAQHDTCGVAAITRRALACAWR